MSRTPTETPPLNTSFARRFWITFSAHVVGIYATILNSFRATGLENIPRQGGVLLAANHISAFETILLPVVIIRHFPMRMLWAPAKEELFRKPLERWLYSTWGAFPVKRGRDVRAAKVLNELLRDQRVMLFPEGTRHRDGRLGQGNRGVGKVIYDTRPTVIPTALIGLNHWKFLGLRQQGEAVFGEPLDLADLYRLPDCKETHQLIVDRVMAAIAELLKAKGAYVGEC